MVAGLGCAALAVATCAGDAAGLGLAPEKTVGAGAGDGLRWVGAALVVAVTAAGAGRGATMMAFVDLGAGFAGAAAGGGLAVMITGGRAALVGDVLVDPATAVGL
ncbi:MAG: hypothetical protein COC12_01680 [Rhodobacteraceae bacterium]|nr:MAG: hypothetical protein COC12_01680 [Paracoccaceae bacterium]